MVWTLGCKLYLWDMAGSQRIAINWIGYERRYVQMGSHRLSPYKIRMAVGGKPARPMTIYP